MLPKTPAGVRYASSNDFNCYITVINPNNGQAADGTPNAPATVKQNVYAKVEQWRGKETDKTDTRVAVSSYKMVIPYPKTWSLDTGMQIMLRGQLHNIESFSDPDGQRVELHIWTFVTNDTVSN
jgi:SPP1 family predicted phage head-tail adaptor